MILVWISAGIILVTVVIITIVKFLNKDNTLSAVEKSIKENNYSKALKLAQQHISTNSSDIVSLNYMGQIYEGLNNYKSAIDYYERASVAAEKEAMTNVKIQTLIKIGSLYKKIDMPKDALGYFSLVLDEHPKHSKALYEAADILYRFKNYKKAKEYLATLIKIKPDNLRAHFLYARVLFQVGEYQSCSKQLSALIPNLAPGDSTNVQARMLLADSYVKLKQYKASIKVLNTLLNSNDIFETVLVKIINIMILDHNYTQAIAMAKKYVSRVSKEVQLDVYYQIATAYYKEGEIYNAIQMWQQAHSIDSRYKDVSEILSQFKILIQYPQLRSLYDKNNSTFEQFVINAFSIKVVNQVVRDPQFMIITGGDEVHIFYRMPNAISAFVIENIGKHLHTENFNTIKVFLYSIFGADSSAKNHVLYRKMEEFSGETMINKMRKG